MRNFDAELSDDLTFVIGGETFAMRYVRPEVLAEWEDEPDEAEETALQSIQRLDRRIESFLTAEDVKRWRSLRERDNPAIPFVQLRELVRWMVQEQSVRPTEQPSPSGGGRGSTGGTSSGRSRSAVAA